MENCIAVSWRVFLLQLQRKQSQDQGETLCRLQQRIIAGNRKDPLRMEVIWYDEKNWKTGKVN